MRPIPRRDDSRALGNSDLLVHAAIIYCSSLRSELRNRLRPAGQATEPRENVSLPDVRTLIKRRFRSVINSLAYRPTTIRARRSREENTQ